MNHLSGAERLANTYHVMRHGESKANQAGVIVSRIETDRGGDWGLSGRGRRQAAAAARASGLPADTVICSSDFSRTRETAEIVRAHLGAAEVTVAAALRERCFGDLEGTPVAGYAQVWAADEADAGRQPDGHPAHGYSAHGHPAHGHPARGVEPAAAVLDRATAFVADLERRHSGRDILLVSHGDTLQILQAGFLRMDPARHRALPHLGTAEIRRLDLGG
ncbi:MAG TPA: histidine phosphatase family protein [Trebonia sp.]|nr:histidine phosphatase family protein [Trebonia sp.]